MKKCTKCGEEKPLDNKCAICGALEERTGVSLYVDHMTMKLERFVVSCVEIVTPALEC